MTKSTHLIKGFNAGMDGQQPDKNPYIPDTMAYLDWEQGRQAGLTKRNEAKHHGKLEQITNPA